MKKDELEDLLDRALQTYSARQPRQGFEQRIIERVHAASKAQPMRWPRWIFAIPALAGVLFVLMFKEQAERPPIQPLTATLPSRLPPPVEAVKRLPRTRHAVNRAPGAETFPAPAPLTREDLALVQLFRRMPEQARGLSMEFAGARPLEPIQLEPMTGIRSNND